MALFPSSATTGIDPSKQPLNILPPTSLRISAARKMLNPAHSEEQPVSSMNKRESSSVREDKSVAARKKISRFRAGLTARQVDWADCAEESARVVSFVEADEAWWRKEFVEGLRTSKVVEVWCGSLFMRRGIVRAALPFV